MWNGYIELVNPSSFLLLIMFTKNSVSVVMLVCVAANFNEG
jgi:hypothetical protein